MLRQLPELLIAGGNLSLAHGEFRQPGGIGAARRERHLGLVAGRPGDQHAPATRRCWSTASRATVRRMISEVPSKMRVTRISRSTCSTGTGMSPAPSANRPSRSRGRRKPGPTRPPRATRARRHRASLSGLDANVVSLVVGHAARYVHDRFETEGSRSDESDPLGDCIVLSHRLAPLHAPVPVLPGNLRRPFSGARDHARYRQTAGVERGEGDLQPRPSWPMTFSEGTKTSAKRVSEFSMPLSPMKLFRCSIVTPGLSVGMMKAVMPPRCPSLGGTVARTTMTSATVPLVPHSFVPSTT